MSCYDFDCAFRALDKNDENLKSAIDAARTEIWLLHQELRELRLAMGFPESRASVAASLSGIARAATEALAE